MTDAEKLVQTVTRVLREKEAGHDYSRKSMARAAIRAVLEGIREPTPKATVAGWRARPTKEEVEEHANVHALYRAIWQAMLNQLLKELDQTSEGR